MKVVFKWDGQTLQIPVYEKQGLAVKVREYGPDEWGCKIGAAFKVADTAIQAIEQTIESKGDTPVNADSVSQPKPAESEELSEQELTRLKAQAEQSMQSLYSGKLSRKMAAEVQSRLDELRAKISRAEESK